MIATAYFVGSILLMYIAYNLYERESSRAYLSLALFLAGIYVYLEFVAFKVPTMYPLIFKLEVSIYVLSSYFFYRTFRSIYGKFSYTALTILLLMLLYILFAPLINHVDILGSYFVEYYNHGWGEIVVVFFYIFILLFLYEGRKLSKEVDEETRTKLRMYTHTVVLTVTLAAVTRFLCLTFLLPHLDSLVLLAGYTYLYFLFKRANL